MVIKQETKRHLCRECGRVVACKYLDSERGCDYCPQQLCPPRGEDTLCLNCVRGETGT